MTKPLTLVAMLMLTIIAGCAGYMVFRTESKDSQERGKAMAQCIDKNLMRKDIDNLVDYCRARV